MAIKKFSYYVAKIIKKLLNGWASFNGAGSCIIVKNSPTLRPVNYLKIEVRALLRAWGSNGNMAMVSMWNSGDQPDCAYTFIFDGYNLTFIVMAPNGTPTAVSVLADFLIFNEVVDLKAIYTGSELQLYYNGSLKRSITYSGGIKQITQRNLVFGVIREGSNAYALNGMIDYVKLTTENGLAGYWEFNENAQDKSGNNNHGIEYNGVTYITE